MVIKCDDSYIPQVVEYIGADKWENFYLYADMLEYRTEGPDFGLWISKQDDILGGVAYRYYDTVHLLCRGSFADEDMAMLINSLDPKCIVGIEETIERLRPRLKGTYKQELSYIFRSDSPMKTNTRYQIKPAYEEDIPDIVSAMMEEDIYRRVYTYDGLCRQMQEGLRSGKRRIFILRGKSGRFLASFGTYVETPEASMTGGLIVDRKVKRLGFGAVMNAYVTNLLLSEGRIPLGLVNTQNKDSVELGLGLGSRIMGISARLLQVTD